MIEKEPPAYGDWLKIEISWLKREDHEKRNAKLIGILEKNLKNLEGVHPNKQRSEDPSWWTAE